jgi:hypothetical protein
MCKQHKKIIISSIFFLSDNFQIMLTENHTPIVADNTAAGFDVIVAGRENAKLKTHVAFTRNTGAVGRQHEREQYEHQ